jgi:hypothetical protein
MGLDVQSFLKENNLGKLGKTFRVYSGDLLFEEYKAYPPTAVGGEALKLTYIYSGNVQVAQQAEVSTWTQEMQDTIDSGNGTGPTGILLSNSTISENASIGTFIGNLTAQNGEGPFTWTITDDPDNKFQLDGNDLEVGASLDFDTANTHNVTIQVEDDNGDTFEKTFLITVTEAAVGANDKEVTFNGDKSSTNNLEIYKNGSGVATSNIENDLTVGSDITSGVGTLYGLRADGANYFQGRLDNFMIFDKVLSAAEVTELYNSGDPLETLTGTYVTVSLITRTEAL